MNEEERAELFRQQRRSRRQARCENFRALAGSRQAREDLSLAWRPPVLARLEAQAGPDLLDEEMVCDVPYEATGAGLLP